MQEKKLDGLLAETFELLKLHQVKVVERDKPIGILYHECSVNDECVDIVCLGLADVIFTHDGCFDGIQHTHVVVTGNKVSNKVVAVVCRRFKTDDIVVVFIRKIRGRKTNIWKPSPSFVNLNGFMSSVPLEDMADAKWPRLAMSKPT